ncbi:MAG: ribose ABC transporter permease [bacterium]|nr:ribose ABC transporter permease [bacterium]
MGTKYLLALKRFTVWLLSGFTTIFIRFGRELGPLAGLIAISLFIWALTPYFLTVENLRNIVQQSSINAIIALGMTFVILTAGIDLSVGSILALSAVVMAKAMQAGLPPSVTIGVGLAAGAACGLLNGALIAWGGLPPFIVTLGMMSSARGAALVVAEGRPISGFGPEFQWLAQGSVLGVPMPIWILLALTLMGYLTLAKTSFGRRTYAIGGNEEAALLSGVNVNLLKLAIYAISGLASAVAGVLLTARLNSASPNAGIAYELDAIAATVIGGTSLMGGEGGVFGTLVGALIIGVLRNGLNLLNVSSYLQSIVIGAVIVVASLLDRYIKSHQNSRLT